MTLEIVVALVLFMVVILVVVLFPNKDGGIKVSKPGADSKIVVNEPMLAKLDKIIELLGQITRSLANK